MKTAISIPDDVFEQVVRLARWSRKSCSELFGEAMRKYVARHAPDDATDAMNRVCPQVGDTKNQFVSTAAHRILERTEW